MADNDALSAALGALEIGVFRQDDGGGFVSVGPVPAWMAAFSRNPTFPFLGAFLGQARAFWREPQSERRARCIRLSAKKARSRCSRRSAT